MSQQPVRHQRSSAGLVGAMVVTVLVVLAFVAFRGLVRDNDAVDPTPAVDYAEVATQARQAGELIVVAPPSLPRGWKATSATYEPGRAPHWHLGVLTADERYIGVEESTDTGRALVEQYIGDDARAAGAVGIDTSIPGARGGSGGSGGSWQAWEEPGGDYAVVRRLGKETVLVGGSAPPAQIRALASSLTAPAASAG